MNRVKELRARAGMMQKELALAIGVSHPTVSEWEHQKKDPTGERLNRLTERLVKRDPERGTLFAMATSADIKNVRRAIAVLNALQDIE